MSLILDALRKIELERKAKRQSSQEIRTEVLNYRGITPATEKPRIIPITAALLLISAAVACFFYFKKADPLKIASPPQRETLRQEATPITPPQPLQPPPSDPPAQKSVQREVKSSAAPVKQSTNTVTIKQNNGDEGITVSGIAWQDERSLRRAVINGFLVGEGAEILGAKIIEIKESRVRFSRGGEVFEVVHTSGAGK
jgi:general secretion pathway protein B